MATTRHKREHCTFLCADEFGTDSDARWTALARNCAHDGIGVSEAAKSGTSLLSQFAILLIGPISVGSLIASFVGGMNDAASGSVFDETEMTRELVNVPETLLSQTPSSENVSNATAIPDLVPRARSRPDVSPPVGDGGARLAEPALVEEIVVVVPKRKEEPRGGVRPNPPVMLSVQ